MTETSRSDIAIVGMALTVPGAQSPAEFWDNLKGGVESITRLDDAALLEAGERPDLIHHKNYVPAAALLDGYETFDAEFFGFSPKEAAILDPQHRKFLETAWTALEDAGHTPDSLKGRIGVYAGCGMGSYFYFNICSNPDLVDDVGMFLLRHTGNDKDFLSTRVSHVFDLNGPSINLQTACSTSLVAIHYAARALRDGECDAALAGGVTIELPQGRGYMFKENEILSPDGHCHAFDHRAQGTVFGSGSGTVVLRRLEDALADGDHIYAVLKGSAVNNDGAAKAGYLAPSVDGQSAAIRAALTDAGTPADTIDYVECHGTGTYLGDPIEVSALTDAYRSQTGDSGFCKIGSVKTNIGHLDTAAGVAGLIKTTLALKHGQIPPSLNYEAPNPAIDFDASPFRVNAALSDWTSHKGPRRAAVNALGVGGTNAHAILEQAPQAQPSEEADWPFHVLCLSGRSKAALDANSKALATHLRAHPDLSLADVSYTLKNGRKAFEKRRIVVAETPEEAADLLDQGDPRRVFTHDHLGDAPEVVFMFPGGGAQYPNMARDLYETEPVFAEWMDRGLDHLDPQLDYNIRTLWLPEPGAEAAAAETLKQPSVQLPLIMIVEYALAQLWQSWGVRPAALVGHSMGENTAACLAGVMTFEDCIDLVLLRGRLFDTVPAGGMLSVSMAIDDLRPLIGADLDIASVNAPQLGAVSGPQEALDRLAADLTAKGIEHQRVPIDIAAHSRMLDPILDEFRGFLAKLDLQSPQIPFLSNRTGQPITDAQATSPDYWTEQLRRTVLFADCITTLAKTKGRVYLEVGPGKALSSLAQMSDVVEPGQVLSSLRHPDQEMADDAYFLSVIGRLWATGVEADWAQIWGEARRNRVPLPTYAFQRSRYFIEPGEAAAAPTPALMRNDDIAEWGYAPRWTPRFAPCDLDVETELERADAQTWLIFSDQAGIAAPVIDRLRAAGQSVVTVTAGDSFAQLGENAFQIAPEQGRAGYDALIAAVTEADRLPTRIAHFWLVTDAETFRPGSSFFTRNMEHGFYSLMHLAQALADAEDGTPRHLIAITNGAARVRGEALPYPEKATLAGPAGVIPRELPGVTCATLDIQLPQPPERPSGLAGLFAKTEVAPDTLTTPLLEDLLAEPGNRAAALRGDRRYEKTYKSYAISDETEKPVWRDGGTYLITGGFGGIGQTVAADLIRDHGARIILLSRSALPERAEWDDHLRRHSRSDATSARIRAVQTLEALGGEVMVAEADVCHLDQMQSAVAEAMKRFGPITGVIHAAGHINDGPLLAKSPSEVEAVFAPKITGLRVLDSLFPDGALDVMVLFSSSSTATTPAGQIDYVAANAYLNAYAEARAGGETRVMAVNWGVWSDVGMAADAMARRTGEIEPDPMTPCDQPLLDQAGFDAEGNRRFQSTFGPNAWVFDEHRTKAGDALLPGTGFIELAAQAWEADHPGEPFEIKDLFFFRPLDISDKGTREVTLSLVREAGGAALDVRSDASADGRTGTVLNAQAQLARLSLGLKPGHIDPGAIAKRCPKTASGTTAERLRSPQEAHLNFGARWHVLHSTALGDGEGLAHLALPEAYRDTDAAYRLHPGLLDIATGWAMPLIDGYQGAHLWVPVSYRSIRVFRALPADILSWARITPGAEGFVSFDVTLCDRAGEVIVEIRDFQMKRLDTSAGFAAQSAIDPADIRVEDASGQPQAPLSADEERLLHTISQGIRPEDGPKALTAALASGLPQMVVSSLPLPDLIAQTAASAAPKADGGQSFERPDLDSDYVAPRTAIEDTLAGFWQNLLGVDQVGVKDSFFDLGGHSLIAVRLFAMIKKTYDVQFPISVLFEAPTIETCAALIAERVGDVAPSGDAAPAEAKPSFTHIVPLHQGEPGGGTPFFIVAGMFGNVLNLRHLALLTGGERPVYGLQARGLIGNDEPHRRMEDAARDYIAEMRQVQPKGPYLVGGFSGGGITAFEIARQLQDAGEEIGAVIMLDTPLPQRPTLGVRDKALIKAQEMRQKGPAYLVEWARNRAAWERAKRAGQVGPVSDNAAFNNDKIEAAFYDAIAHYEVRPWDGPLHLFRPPLEKHWRVSSGQWVNRDREFVYEDNDWTRFVPGVSVIEVPGDHDSMVLVPNVSVLAGHLNAIFADADRSAAWPRATAAE
ncbi:type I polyketide synthase [Thalassococcus sp. S3]|uniref:type I polyketide synthase n=1 Tax=Thalassococcus sp. S3 TaxID=2017482 RepID=UPI001024400E|nr:type I polyketide synthase [Thalassococcus sp. S3]QBF31984.1 polyketide synthase [Thalassococcus sp. S3]